MKRILSPEIERVLVERYPTEGRRLAAVLGVAESTVANRASRVGVRKRRRTGNPAYFETWSPSMAYDPGYIYTDGNVREQDRVLQLQCSTRDESILVGLMSRPASTGKLSRRVRVQKSGHRSEMSYTTVHCKAVVRCLMDRHGILPRKSFTDTPFPEVPDEYLGHFLRGALDGDGTVSASRVGNRDTLYVAWLGQHTFVRTLAAELRLRLGLRQTKLHAKRHNLLYVKWTTAADLAALHGFLYPPGDYPFLARKRDKLESHLRQKGVIP